MTTTNFSDLDLYLLSKRACAMARVTSKVNRLWLLAELRRQNRAGEEQIHALLMVKIMALGTFVSCSLVIFFSPSNKRNDSKVGGAFMVAKKS